MQLSPHATFGVFLGRFFRTEQPLGGDTVRVANTLYSHNGKSPHSIVHWPGPWRVDIGCLEIGQDCKSAAPTASKLCLRTITAWFINIRMPSECLGAQDWTGAGQEFIMTHCMNKRALFREKGRLVPCAHE